MFHHKDLSRLKGLILAALLMIFSSCAVNPVSGKHELMLLSEAEEIQLGRQTDAQVASQYGIYKDGELTGYLNQMGKKMAKISHRPNLPYEFKILDTPVVNAFAVPGGYVYFTRGILANLNSEAELAGVMGHELGHITARHSAQQYSRSQLAQMALGGAMMFSETASILAPLAQMGVGLLFLSYSRDNEREADRLGVAYSSQAGYDATHMARFFETLERMQPEKDGSGLPEWFSTHPNPDDRIGAVQRDALKWQKQLGLKDFKVNGDVICEKLTAWFMVKTPGKDSWKNMCFTTPYCGFNSRFRTTGKFKIREAWCRWRVRIKMPPYCLCCPLKNHSNRRPGILFRRTGPAWWPLTGNPSTVCRHFEWFPEC